MFPTHSDTNRDLVAAFWGGQKTWAKTMLSDRLEGSLFEAHALLEEFSTYAADFVSALEHVTKGASLYDRQFDVIWDNVVSLITQWLYILYGKSKEHAALGYASLQRQFQERTTQEMQTLLYVRLESRANAVLSDVPVEQIVIDTNGNLVPDEGE